MDARPRLEDPPEALARFLRERGRRRAFFVRGEGGRGVRASDPGLDELARALAADPAWRGHEGIFLEVGRASGALSAAFVHDTHRGQAQGGVRHWSYPRLGDLLRDGLRLSLGMTRKNALAGLWWGGGKGILSAPAGEEAGDRAARRARFCDYGAFVASLRGAYVCAEDVGTTPEDLACVLRVTRFVTCLPPRLGGSGNPSACTAAGVVAAMRAALACLGIGELRGKRVAMQGGGQVGAAMIEQLLEAGAACVRVAELRADRRQELLDRFDGRPVEVLATEPDDPRLFAEDCDILAPNALGGVLGPKTIPLLLARLVCGAANNPLVDDERDGRALAERGIAFVPEVIANRMGIVHCANEQYGALPGDPAVQRHLDPAWEHSIPALTRRVLEQARAEGIPPVVVANRLADERAREPHPIWGQRSRALLEALVAGSWHEGDAAG